MSDVELRSSIVFSKFKYKMEFGLTFTIVFVDVRVLVIEPIANIIPRMITNITEIQIAVSEPSVDMKYRLSILLIS